jgi:hypothetical protein
LAARFPVFPVEPGISSISPSQAPLGGKTVRQNQTFAPNSGSRANREFSPVKPGIKLPESGSSKKPGIVPEQPNSTQEIERATSI